MHMRLKTWAKDGWKKVIVCNDRLEINARTLSVDLSSPPRASTYQDGVEKNLIKVSAHIYEYTRPRCLTDRRGCGARRRRRPFARRCRSATRRPTVAKPDETCLVVLAAFIPRPSFVPPAGGPGYLHRASPPSFSHPRPPADPGATPSSFEAHHDPSATPCKENSFPRNISVPIAEHAAQRLRHRASCCCRASGLSQRRAR